MNERIRELAKQAEEVVFCSPSTGKETKQLNLEKFAELLVKECTNLLPKDSVRDENGVHMFYVIRDHFGVSPFNH
jgi:hypothetical protein